MFYLQRSNSRSVNPLTVLCADLVQTNRTSESIKGKRKEKCWIYLFLLYVRKLSVFQTVQLRVIG